jgi:Tfp pilus assembly protein FimT
MVDPLKRKKEPKMLKIANNQRGITLMELMIIIVTVGILAAMAVPRFMDYLPKLKSKTAVKEVVSQLRLARSAAIAEKRPIGVYFDEDEGRYVIFADSVDLESKTYSESDPQIREKTFTEGIEMGYMTFADDVVIFDPDGSASSSGELAFVIPASGTMYEVSVLAGTGKVKMEEIESVTKKDVK